MKQKKTDNPLNSLRKHLGGAHPSQRLLIAIVIFSYFIGLILLLFEVQLDSGSSKGRLDDFEVGKVAERDLIVDHDIIYIDQDATNQRKKAMSKLVPPIFRIQDDITRRCVTAFDQFSEIYKKLTTQGGSSEQLFLALQAGVPGMLALEEVESLVAAVNAREIIDFSRDKIRDYLSEGIVSLPSDDPEYGNPVMIELNRWREGEKEREEINLENILTEENLKSTIEADMLILGYSVDSINLATMLVSAFTEENTFFDAEKTTETRERAGLEVEPVEKKLIKNEIIIKKGFIITEDNMAKVKVLGSYATTVNINNILGAAFFLLIIYALGTVLFRPPVFSKKLPPSRVYMVLSLLFLYGFMGFVTSRLSFPGELFPLSIIMPTALVSMIISIVIHTRSGISASIIMSLLLVLIPGTGVYDSIFALFSGIAGTFVVRGAVRRIELMKSGIGLGLVHLFVAIVIGFFQNADISWFFTAAFWGIINALLCVLMNLGLLPFFEHILNAPTPFRLMELSDTNTPIMKRMITLAPGTYGHSVSVANLAESACRELGANPLLARVGAYYHDIGKIDQSEYFIENQQVGNKHDDLKPSLSAAVIKSHVKIGIEKGKELGLPKEVIDIIGQHHGNTVISYFYTEALKSKKDEKVAREDFSYPGIPPTSREAAVVMLADSVEAASRTLKKPTVAKLEKFVWNMIIEKFESGQLSNCELTIRNLETIKKTFVQILAGLFHSRIEYPEMKESQGNNS
jgi:putative nucleotidyltransferase with HDIG domain